MKKQILLLMAGILFSISGLFAQDGMQRQTPDQRTKTAMEKMAPLNLDEATKAKAQVIMADFYNAQQKAMEELRAGGNGSREEMQAKRKELAGARDAKLKEIFTQEQMKRWIDEIEPTLRPQRQKN